MAEPLISVNGVRAQRLQLSTPGAGAWQAAIDFDSVVPVAGSVELQIGAAVLSGQVSTHETGIFTLRTRALVIGGKGWQTIVGAVHHHNDAGVKASTIIKATADAVGETVDALELAAANTVAGVDYTRTSGPASRILTHLAPAWWVAYDGVTHLSERAQSELTHAVELLEYDPRSRVATLAVDDLTHLPVGAVLRDPRLTSPLVVRSLECNIDGSKMRLLAWCGDA